ncbi:MAG: hypothetical protein AB8H79_00440 [Myxococcota bacterium]
MRKIWVAVVGAVACGGRPTDCIEPPPPCPDDAPMIGVDNGFSVDRAQVQWTWNRRCKFSSADPVYVRVPDDIVGLSVAVDNGSDKTAIGYAALDGEVLLDISEVDGTESFYSEPWYHGYNPVSAWVRPMRPGDEPTGGCMTIVGVTEANVDGEVAEVAFASRRAEEGDAIDVVVGKLAGTNVDDSDLMAGVQRMEEVLGDAGIGLRTINVVEVPWDGEPFVAQEGDALDALRAFDLGGSPEAMYLLVVQDFTEGDGTLGFAAGIPGPVGLQETASSAVVLSVDAHLDEDFVAFLPGLFGETAAHEIGHQLGLFHTTEAEGTSHDFLDDTPACEAAERDADGDGQVTAEECENFGGRNVMFWTAGDFSQEEWSDGQRFVLQRSPVVVERD